MRQNKMKKKTNCGIIMCGGVISQSTFDKSPWGNMMKMVMPDRWFAKYDKEKDPKKAHRLYMKYARSMKGESIQEIEQGEDKIICKGDVKVEKYDEPEVKTLSGQEVKVEVGGKMYRAIIQ